LVDIDGNIGYLLQMKINDDHLYHGAALIQIAEYPTFKAINPFKLDNGSNSRSSYVINTDTVVYLKYASKPKKNSNEYLFTFTEPHLKELKDLEKKFKSKVFVVLICLEAHEICALTLAELNEHIKGREIAKGESEPNYQIVISVNAGKAFRVYMNDPGKRNKALKKQTVKRNHFPKVIFEQTAQ